MMGSGRGRASGLALALLGLAGCAAEDSTVGAVSDASPVDGLTADLVGVAGDTGSTFVPAEDGSVASGDGVFDPTDGGAGSETTEPDCEPGTGCFGDPCEDGLDCYSGVCGLHLGDYVCSKLCETTCPDGWECRLTGGDGSDPYSVCVSRFTHLCQPCTTLADCSTETKQNACVSYGSDGSFCGGACDEDTPCPPGYLCDEVDVAGGGVSAQCVPDVGECACSTVATSLAMGTGCSVANDLGSCEGVRSCGPGGLGACDALAPVPEACDGVDNDCNGQTDEGFEAVTCGLGACEHTVESCVGGEGQICDPLEGATEEVCNDADDDCDGEVDDGLEALSCGLGACEHTVPSCDGGEVEICDPLEGVSDETCDGVDNDCDGETDEEQAPLACGLGVCEHTVVACIAGQIQTCDPLEGASPEICNGLDDDCDGEADLGLGQTTCGLGACDHSIDNCVEGTPQFCDPFQGASADVCNGVDDDCDGEVDEEALGQTACGVGACAHTVETCVDGTVQSCDPLEGTAEEVCDGVDNDCDGDTDEEQAPLSCGLGVCEHVVDGCVSGVTQICDPLAGAASENCNGLDDDCDGEADQGLGETTCGQGACGHTVDNCVEGTPQFCDPFEGSASEVCNGVDDDCDGEADEALDPLNCGVGVCVHTVPSCLDGGTQSCDPLEGATDETCDGLDNDCDGDTDEDQGDLSCGLGVCAKTLPACVGGQAQSCDPLEGATDEICDGLDNDCDGEADQGLGQTSCGVGVCAHTVDNCVDGSPRFCDPFEGGGLESCNGEDDDCDGDADEDLGQIACGVGACAHSIESCVGGEVQICDPLAGATDETCDGVDNDCDGLTDEDQAPNTCGVGVCVHTAESCVGGELQVCDPLSGATDELCNGLDDDCDGAADEELGETSCGLGACGHVVTNCVEGAPQFCDPFQGATAEVCNTVDDDCDGEADDGLGTLTCGLGVCQRTVDVCVAGDVQICVPLDVASAEICDGLDNDCDGEVDEELGQISCGVSVCAHAVDGCVEGVVQVCDPLEGATPELCNGEDDDCDGEVDEELGETSCGQGICVHTVPNCLGGQEQVCDPLEGAIDEVCNGVDNDCDGDTDEDTAGPCQTCAGEAGLSNKEQGTTCGEGQGCDAAGACADLCAGGGIFTDCKALRDLCPDLGDGTYVIAPGGSSISVQCEMGISGGGWTQMTQEYLNTMSGETWEYLYTLNNGWYRSPPTSHVWSWDSFHGVAGTYAYGQGDNQTGTFGCNTNEGGGWGVGCSNGGGNQWKCIPHYQKDPGPGRSMVCQDQPDAFGVGACGAGAQIWVRKQ